VSNQLSIVPRIAAAAALIWAALLLAGQLLRALRRRRSDYSRPAGSAFKGAFYNLTVASSPAHKESARLHLAKFGAGVILHAGIAWGVVRLIWFILNPGAPPLYPYVTAALFGVAFLAAVFLLIRRALSPLIRPISSFDDYFAALLTGAFVLTAAARELALLPPAGFAWVAAALFVYLPFGKLRHALFCVAGRIEYGLRLGSRGVYPARHEARP